MKKALFIVIAILLAIQLIRPDFTNPQVNPQKSLHASVPVIKILKTSCYDCHSNETKYPWYTNIAPISWFIANHIHEGRNAMNFSEWAKMDPKLKLARLKRANHLIQIDFMPINNYTWMHKKAKLNLVQKQLLQQFINAEIKKLENPKS